MASSSVILSTSQISSLPFNFARFGGLRACSPLHKVSARAVVLRRSSSVSRLKIVCAQTTLEDVQNIIASQLSVDRSLVLPETKFSELGADSLDTVEIVMALEEKFQVSIDEQAAENISTVQQVASLIEDQKVAAS